MNKNTICCLPDLSSTRIPDEIMLEIFKFFCEVSNQNVFKEEYLYWAYCQIKAFSPPIYEQMIEWGLKNGKIKKKIIDKKNVFVFDYPRYVENITKMTCRTDHEIYTYIHQMENIPDYSVILIKEKNDIIELKYFLEKQEDMSIYNTMFINLQTNDIICNCTYSGSGECSHIIHYRMKYSKKEAHIE